MPTWSPRSEELTRRLILAYSMPSHTFLDEQLAPIVRSNPNVEGVVLDGPPNTSFDRAKRMLEQAGLKVSIGWASGLALTRSAGSAPFWWPPSSNTTFMTWKALEGMTIVDLTLHEHSMRKACLKKIGTHAKPPRVI